MPEKKYGTVLVFEDGVKREHIEAALSMLPYIDKSYYMDGKPRIEEFDPTWGGPVWYIP